MKGSLIFKLDSKEAESERKLIDFVISRLSVMLTTLKNWYFSYISNYWTFKMSLYSHSTEFFFFKQSLALLIYSFSLLQYLITCGCMLYMRKGL